MYHLKLIKALSYHGVVTATRQAPDVYTDSREVAEAAVATGYFTLVEKPDTAAPPDAEHNKTLDEMNVSELESFAVYHNISLKGVTKKADILAKIRAEIPAAKTENEVDYGSPTMTELEV